MNARTAPTTTTAQAHPLSTFPADGIIPANYTIKSKIPHPNIVLMSQNIYRIRKLFLKVDRERHYLKCGLDRLIVQNHCLGKGLDSMASDSVAAASEYPRYMIDLIENTNIEVLKNELLRRFSDILALVREQHELRQCNDALREDLRAGRQTEEMPAAGGPRI